MNDCILSPRKREVGCVLEVEWFDVVEVFFPCLCSVDACVDVHGFCFGVASDVLEYVVVHSLVPHQGGEHGSEGVWCEFSVEPCLSLFHDLCFDSGFSYFPPDPFSSELVAGTIGSEQVLRVTLVDELEALDHLHCLLVDRDNRGFASFPVL